MRLRALLVVTALAATACGGPRVPVGIGVSEFPTDVLLGSGPDGEADGVGPRPGAGSPVIVVPSPPLVEVLPERTPAPTPVPECPEADPLSAPRDPATRRFAGAPAEAAYPYRVSGSVTLDGATTLLPERAQRSVSASSAGLDGSVTFLVREELGDAVIETTYRVVPESPTAAPAGPLPVDDRQAGIFVTRTRQVDSQGEQDTVWAPPLKILPFPVVEGATWDVASSSPTGRTLIQYTGQVGATMQDGSLGDFTVRVDACGEFVQAWNVTLTEGRAVTPTSDVRFSQSLAIATQFGGLVVADRISAEGTSGGAGIETTRTSTINVVPRRPG